MKPLVKFFGIILMFGPLLFTGCSENDEPGASPIASFKISNPNPFVGDTLYFENLSLNAKTFKWFFGDGGTSTLKDPSHVYLNEGDYEIGLEAISSEATNLFTMNITVKEPFNRWKKIIIDPSVQLSVSIDHVDMDGDGDLDVVGVGFLEDKVMWYENQHPTWIEHVIDDNASGVTFAYSADFDSDGDIDIAANWHSVYKMVLYKNTGSGWEMEYIDKNTDHADMFQVADMNLDGKMDIITAGNILSGGDVIWYENDYPNWHERIIENGSGKYASIWIDQVGIEGIPFVYASMTDEDKIVYFGRSTVNDSIWSKVTIASGLNISWGISTGDIDKDGKKDVLATAGGPYKAGNRVFWYKPGYEWTEHIIEDDLNGANFVLQAEIDDDQYVDIIVSGYRDNDIIWYEYIDETWTKSWIDDNMGGPRLFEVFDVNGDGLNDIVVAGFSQVICYEQQVDPEDT